jgi:hypothetical protein
MNWNLRAGLTGVALALLPGFGRLAVSTANQAQENRPQTKPDLVAEV